MLTNQHKHREDGDSRCFTMLPDRGFGNLYVALEGQTLGKLCRAAKVPLPPKFSFVGRADAWNEVFRLHKVGSQHGTPDTKAAFFPGKSIRTDGVACSVVMFKKTVIPSATAKKRKRCDDEPRPSDILHIQAHHPKLSDRVVGIDPGKRPDILVGVVRPTNCSDEEVFKVSVKEWRERTGFNKRAQVKIDIQFV